MGGKVRGGLEFVSFGQPGDAFGRNVADIAFPAGELVDFALIHVQTQHRKPRLVELDDQRQTHIAQADDSYGCRSFFDFLK